MFMFEKELWCFTSNHKYWTRHAGHCWRSRNKLISDVQLWTPTYDREKAGRTARTYIQQLCEDTGCSLEDLPEAMNDREKWREKVRYIRAGGTTWWWWWCDKVWWTCWHKQVKDKTKNKNKIKKEKCLYSRINHSLLIPHDHLIGKLAWF